MASQLPQQDPRAWAFIMTEYVHKYYPDITCTVVQETSKGFKVLQNDRRHKKKPKVAFYTFLDFSKDKGVWMRK